MIEPMRLKDALVSPRLREKPDLHPVPDAEATNPVKQK
jgi:hypothetical protein